MNYNHFDYIPFYAQDFLYHLKNVKGFSQKTVDQYYLDLKIFFRFVCDYKGLTTEKDFNKIDASNVKPSVVENLSLSDLYVYLNFVNDERSNQTRARCRKISSLKSLYKHLCKQAIIKNNPTLYLDAPKQKASLPVYLSVDEALKLIECVDGENKERNTLILTLFLHCGLRLSELVNLNLTSINEKNLRVIGKGNKERNLYLNTTCLSALENYMNVRRKIVVKAGSENALFISRNGTRISNRMVQNIVETFLKKSGLDNKNYSTHKLRHTAATLMYQNGVDIRVLQEVLGHSNLGTTQIYTHLADKQVEDAIDKNPLNKK